MRRGQSHVVGVAVLLGVTVVALGGLTVAVGGLMESQAASADARRVADDMAAQLEPVSTTGHRRGRIHLGSGRLRTVERQVRLYRNGSLVRSLAAGGLVYRTADRRVAFVGSAIVRGSGDASWAVREPPILAGGDPPMLVAGVARLEGEDVAVGGSGGSVVLAQSVSHRRVALGRGTFELAVETRATGALAEAFRAQGATVNRRDVDGDGVPSVVASYPGRRRGFLVVHTVGLEVGHG